MSIEPVILPPGLDPRGPYEKAINIRRLQARVASLKAAREKKKLAEPETVWYDPAKLGEPK